MLAVDYIGISAVIGSISAAIVSVIIAWRQNATVPKINDIHEQTATSNGSTLGELAEANDTRNRTTDTVNGERP